MRCCEPAPRWRCCADGDEAVRRVTGDLKVRIPLLGGKVEKAIVDGVGDHLSEEADVVAASLEG